MRVFELFYNRNVVEFDIEKLVNGLESSSYRDIVLELNRDLMIYEGLEKTGQTYISYGSQRLNRYTLGCL